jgi:hypothetical protein
VIPYKFDKSGKEVWSWTIFECPSNQSVVSAVTNSKGQLFFSGSTGPTHCFNGNDMPNKGFGFVTFMAKEGFPSHYEKQATSVGILRSDKGDIFHAISTSGTGNFSLGSYNESGSGASTPFVVCDGVGPCNPTSMSTHPSGDVIVGANFYNTVNFVGTPLVSAGQHDLVVGRIKGNKLVWSKRFGDAGPQYDVRVASAKDGSIFLVGRFAGTVDLGGGPLVATGATYSVFVAKLGADGSHIWSRILGNDFTTIDARVNGLGNLVFAGAATASSVLDGKSIPVKGDVDTLVGVVAADGSLTWSRTLGGAGYEPPTSLALGTMDEILIGGTFQGAVDFGTGPLVSAGKTDLFVVRLSP